MNPLSKNKERTLVKLYPTVSSKDISKMLGVPIWLIEKRADELGLQKDCGEWASEDINILVQMYPNTPNEHIARILNKTKSAVEHFAYRFSLQKNRDYFVNIINTEEETELVAKWSKEYDHKIHGNSRGNYIIGQILDHMFPNYRILPEHPIGSLKIDLYIHDLKLAVEMHGVQHEEYSDFFYGDKFKFREAQQRDIKKSELCEAMGIGLVVVWHYEKISFGLIRAKIADVT